MATASSQDERAAIAAARRQFELAQAARSSQPDAPAAPSAARERWPEIPGYALRREVRRGGQGVVFEAEQLGTRRTVAIKVLYEGPQSGPAQRARFERELSVLGSLRHPNIVTLYEGGVSGGRLYCVMDFVEGVALDQATVLLDKPAIVQLFVRVCQAVGAAHLRGVIHRDLKPSNILVDPAGEPRVLDFGLAKVNDETLAADAPQMTATGQFVGSLPWSSPEQVDGRSDAIDTRSDVYSMGVLLYQTLTGNFPYSMAGATHEIIERIRSHDPLPPRQAVRRSSSGVADVDDELETIVLKCLQKDRERRYQTAGELARDLERYQRHEPIEAKRDSLLYVLRKQARRYWAVATVSAAFALLLIGGLAVTLWLWRSADAQRVVAERATDRAREAEMLAEARRDDAEQRRNESEAVAGILQGMFGIGAHGDFVGQDFTVRQMLDRHSDEVLTRLAEQPRVELRVRSVLANAYRGLGEFEKARQYGRRLVQLSADSFGPNTAEHAAALGDLALALASGGEEGEQVVELQRRALEIYENLGLKTETQGAMAALARSLLRVGKADECAALLESANPAEAQPRDAISIHWGLAELAESRDEPKVAVELYRQALKLAEAHFGPRDSQSVALRNDLAVALERTGDLAAARSFFEQVVADYVVLYGEDNPRTATAISNLGLNCFALKQVPDAVLHLRRALQIRRKVLPPDHRDLGAGLNNLAWVLEGAGEFGEAIELYREAISTLERSVGRAHIHFVMTNTSLARTFAKSGQHEQAAEQYGVVIELQRSIPRTKPVDLASSLVMRAASLAELKRAAEAEQALREALALRREHLPAEHWLIANTESTLGGVLLDQNKLDEAEPLLLSGAQQLLRSKDAAAERVQQALERLIRLHLQTGNSAALEQWKAELSRLAPKPQ